MGRRVTAVRDARADVRAAEAVLALVIAGNFPPGSRINWTVGEYTLGGEIVRTSGDRLCVRNQATGKQYWINSYRLSP